MQPCEMNTTDEWKEIFNNYNTDFLHQISANSAKLFH